MATKKFQSSFKHQQIKDFLTWQRVVGLFCVVAVVIFFGATLFVAWITRDLPDPDHLQDRVVAESTKMYDRTGQHLLYEVYDGKKRTVVDLATLPHYVIDATVSIEDSHFYEHSGVRWTSIARAIVSDALHLSSGRGGASTLTQQLVKNAILTDEHSLTRKIKEAILALQLERVYTKDQILKLYFNEIPYGGTNYGIESAAQAYFNKSAKDLTLAEAATLAAMPQAPTRYIQDPKALRGRRDYILSKMNEYGYITTQQLKDAQAQTSDIHVSKTSTIAPHFVLYIKDQLINLYGEKTVDQGGLKVITTLDYDLQVASNGAVQSGVEVAEKKYGATNGASVSIDPNNGEILEMVGSRDFFDNGRGGQFNVVTQGVRQPGSSFKPIVYTAAFEKGFTPDTVFYDAETDFPYDGQVYHPHNYDGKTHGPVTMRQALQGSLNIPAVKTVLLVGVDNVLDFADRMGYTTFTNRSQFGPAVVLGGGGVKMIEHVRAYAAFANGGTLYEPVGILKIEDKDGKDITPQRADSKTVLDSGVTATISNVLSDNDARAYVFGAKNHLTLPDRPVAVKTGTTNDYHDAWTVGYTPQIATAVWVGNNDNKVMKGGADGSVVAAPIWQTIMIAGTKKMPVVQFPTPPENTATNPVLHGSTGGVVTVSVDAASGNLATKDTPLNFVVTKTYVPAHDILQYVDPSNPQGPAPTNPASNPEYASWEAGVAAWLSSKAGAGIVTGEPPTTIDTTHSVTNQPTLSIVSPTADQIISGGALNAQITVSAPRGVQRVEYFIDDKAVSTATAFPFSLSANVSGYSAGAHTLKAVAYDDVGNSTSQSVQFQVASGQ
ncbi:MAG: PBP1A family penicillin-binding protein [Candidatus Magasanikbacteria bacterium]|nr:PBP1A family penicillin-binding protein [Candidatus Magasanikbacteria bacterium]